ncbi:hypothetical protein A6U85_07060 [Agrobacterium sp. 13-626]|nr:hypothetical protein DXT98_03530 [Agrobacterium sp. ICMP 7243]KEA07555.1 hypothetical protein CN09_11730 [Rhizobium rhizogenes]OCJ06682.1 hypothetical protein A6U85_07060 [Agrobacterium sp. 13-626]OCJ31795.1 hypothetical protein A6U89_05375 [Agrobacterium sp. B133/95]
MFIIARLSSRSAVAADRGEPTGVGYCTKATDGKGNRLLLSLGIVRWLRLIGMENAVPHMGQKSLRSGEKSSGRDG